MTPLKVGILMTVTFGLANAGFCSNNATNGTLSFQSPGTSIPILLLSGFSVELECCVKSATPAVSWTINGIPLQGYNESWTVSEQGQVVTTSLAGHYVCKASDEYESMNKTFVITATYWDPDCSQGTVGEVRTGYPPTDVYDVRLYGSIQLTCISVMYCGSISLENKVQWFKYSDDPNADPMYYLYRRAPGYTTDVDSATGDFVNISAWFADAAQKVFVVQTILTIRNVTKNELVDVPDALTVDCQNLTTNACTVASPKMYYQCAILLDDGDDLSQNLYRKFANTRLHASSAPSSPTHNAMAFVLPDDKAWEREGIIFGCLLGVFVLVVASVALVYVKYEWHIRVYVKRLMILTRPKGKDQAQYKYDCYIACAHEDEALVYGVLREQLERDLGYRLCLPERDFAIGAAVPEQIGRFIEQSEFFMAIISPRFWTTDWCALAVDIALRTKVKVIAMFILDDPKTKVNKRADIAKALRAPGCSQIMYRTWKKAKGNDSLALKVQCAMPKIRHRSTDQRRDQIEASRNTMHQQQIYYLPSYESAVAASISESKATFNAHNECYSKEL